MSYSFRTVAKGYVENVRYELLFAINNRGPFFDAGAYIGQEDTLDDFMNEVTRIIVNEFDKRIAVIERRVNTTFAMKWLIGDNAHSENKTCLKNGPFATTCDDIGFGDASLPLCEACDTKREIDIWYDQIVKVTGTHIDPRIDGAKIDWAYFGNKLVGRNRPLKTHFQCPFTKCVHKISVFGSAVCSCF